MLDSVGLCHSACSVLLDLDLTKQDCAETAKAFSTEERRSVLDLNLSLSRIALRYAIYKEQLLEHQIVEPEKRYPFDSIEILSPVTATAAAAVGRSTDKDNIAVDDKVDLGAMASEKVADSFFEVIVPCSKRFEAVMLYDLGLDEDDLPITGSKRLLFRKQFVQPFIDQNELIPAAESNSTGNSTSTAKI